MARSARCRRASRRGQRQPCHVSQLEALVAGGRRHRHGELGGVLRVHPEELLPAWLAQQVHQLRGRPGRAFLGHVLLHADGPDGEAPGRLHGEQEGLRGQGADLGPGGELAARGSPELEAEAVARPRRGLRGRREHHHVLGGGGVCGPRGGEERGRRPDEGQRGHGLPRRGGGCRGHTRAAFAVARLLGRVLQHVLRDGDHAPELLQLLRRLLH
mmetsp:Transcript_89358/g.232955  ORF Transcript_89358/g.232955 Transcript_89358/m.232955 type:complete len:214 (-) Transcript_89358:1058-1699(-)